MKTKLLTTALVLGLSSAAFAAPGYQGAPTQHHFRDGMRRPAPVAWTSLSTVSRIQNKQTISVGGLKAFSKLKLEAAQGSTFVDKLVIVFGNGAKQTVNLDKNLAMRGAPLFIDLDGANRRITKVVVYGKSGRRAAINLSAG
jgi:hypothetical protein